jgi:hypothetical protein
MLALRETVVALCPSDHSFFVAKRNPRIKEAEKKASRITH